MSMTVSVDVEPALAPVPSAHVVDDGDGVCGDCLWCEENFERDCNVPTDPKCVWCGHCLGNHADTTDTTEQNERQYGWAAESGSRAMDSCDGPKKPTSTAAD